MCTALVAQAVLATKVCLLASCPAFAQPVGLATSFYNQNHSNIARDLKELLMESNQKVPDFIEADSEFATGSVFRAGSRPSTKVFVEKEKPQDWVCPSCGSS